MSDRSSSINNWTQSIAIVIAGVWALYQFVYIEWIKPETLINIQAEMNVIGKSRLLQDDESLDIIELTIVGENNSDRRAYIAASYYQVYGDYLNSKKENYSFVTSQIEEVLNSRDQYIDKSIRLDSSDLLQVGTAFNKGSWFEPGEKIHMNRLIHVPSQKYDQLQANVFVLSGKNIEKLDIRQRVDKTFSAGWEVSENKSDWYGLASKEGRKIIRSSLDKGTQTVYFAY